MTYVAVFYVLGAIMLIPVLVMSIGVVIGLMFNLNRSSRRTSAIVKQHQGWAHWIHSVLSIQIVRHWIGFAAFSFGMFAILKKDEDLKFDAMLVGASLAVVYVIVWSWRYVAWCRTNGASALLRGRFWNELNESPLLKK